MSVGKILLNIVAVAFAATAIGVMLVVDHIIMGVILLFLGGFSTGFSTLAFFSFRYSANYNPTSEEEDD